MGAIMTTVVVLSPLLTTNMSTKWVPLEAAPEIFNAVSPRGLSDPLVAHRVPHQWSQPLGLPSTLAFNDLFSLDPEFLQFTPEPVFAVLLLFPSRGKLAEARRKEQEDGKGEFKGVEDESKKVWWIKQTVCGSCYVGLLKY